MSTRSVQTSPAVRLVDAHVHLRSYAALEDVAAAGVSAVRDAGMRPDRKPHDCQSANKALPRAISSRWGIYKKGGYGSLFGSAVETGKDIQIQIRSLKQANANVIKVFASGIVDLTRPSSISPGGFSQDELKLIVDEASGLGLRVMAHANGEQAVINCAQAGVHSIEHGFFMTEKALECLAEKRVYWVPTIGALARALPSSGTSPAVHDYASSVIQGQLTMVRRAYLIGVLLAVGTDCVLPDSHYGEAYHREIEYFRAAGIPPEDVSRIAAHNGAQLLGLPVP